VDSERSVMQADRQSEAFASFERTIFHWHTRPFFLYSLRSEAMSYQNVKIYKQWIYMKTLSSLIRI